MDDSSFSEEDIALTVKILVQEPDVRAITGRNESTLLQMRSQSGAGISISEGPSADRVISITGSLEEVYDASRLIIERFELYDEGGDRGNDVDCFYVKVIVPAGQCGPLIGKGGSKIKEIRDSTGAAVQVAADILPHSTERCVNISGSLDAICDCIYEICLILITTPQKYNVIPYQPNEDLIEGPLLVSNGKAYTIQGSVAVPLADLHYLFKNNLAQSYFGSNSATDFSLLSQLAKENSTTKNAEKKGFHLQEIQVPDEIINGAIGRNGIKISEIRQITGAQVIVSDSDDISSDGRERTVTIKGPKESVTLARYLINACIDFTKLSIDNQKDQFDFEPESAISTVINLLGRAGAINILANITGFSTVAEFLSSFNSHYRH